MKLILASASPRRAEILHNAGIPFSAHPSPVDETPMPDESAEDMVMRLSAAKAALAITHAVGPAIVIAADTVVVIDGHILGKPKSTEDARRMLVQLSGHTHSVITGVTLTRMPDAEHRSFLENTQVHFALLSEEEINGYLATEEPYDKAGAYAIQGQGGRFITRIEGDYFNVVGLPLAHLYRELTALGWSETPLI
jgi:septum formation protein